MSCGCGNSPCSCDQNACDILNEPLSSALNNFISAFFGSLTKTCVNGSVNWLLPCDLQGGIPNYPRNPGEGVACYVLRVFQDVGTKGICFPVSVYRSGGISDGGTGGPCDNESGCTPVLVGTINLPGESVNVCWPNTCDGYVGVEAVAYDAQGRLVYSNHVNYADGTHVPQACIQVNHSDLTLCAVCNNPPSQGFCGCPPSTQGPTSLVGTKGYRSTTLTNANVILFRATDVLNQDFNGTLTGPVTIFLTSNGATIGDEFYISLSGLVISAVNTLSINSDATNLLTLNTAGTVTGYIKAVYTGNVFNGILWKLTLESINII